MPDPVGRGAGLGNELVVWAKSIIAGHVLDAKALHPAWGANARGYHRFFGTSQLDFAAYRMLKKVMPTLCFNEAAYQAHGGGDYGRALRVFAAANGLDGRSHYLLLVEGLWGGMDMLSHARLPLLAHLLAARNTTRNLYAVDAAIPGDKLRVAMHVRRGDFSAPQSGTAVRGKFNVALPMDWYLAVMRNLVGNFGNRVHFLIVSDATKEELAPFHMISDHVTTTKDQKMTDISDMLALTFSDFILCSVSSFSLWAVFFSGARYGWYQPHLEPLGDVGAIWGNEPLQRVEDSPTRLAADLFARTPDADETWKFRGVPIGDDGICSEDLLMDLAARLAIKQRGSDLIRYGVAPLRRR